MLKSMTAYSFLEKIDENLSLTLEMRTYNSRHLDCVLRLPMGYAGFEEKIKELIAAKLVRGRVELRLGIKEDSKVECNYEADANRAISYIKACERLRDELNLAGTPLPLEHLLNVPGVIQPAESQTDVDAHWPIIENTVRESVEQVDQMRRREGAYIGEDFVQRLELIEQNLDEIEKAVQGLSEKYRDKLQGRVEALTKGLVELDHSRIAQEAAILADRSDISEEIVRSRSHIKQFRSIMASSEAAGRKLNFLLQEFNREFNTMGAKVGQADAAHLIVDVKSEIEKLREQVQNIE